MLICVTASHKTADFTVLEQLASRGAFATPDVLAADARVHGAVVVSTCNRFEAYLDIEGDDVDDAGEIARDTVMDALSGAGYEGPEGALTTLEDQEAARHLFAVAAGLESVVVGEGEIAGQVRRSLKSAQLAGTTSPQLERLFQRASETQRGVKNRTGLGEAGRSIVRLALDLSNDRVHDWSSARILLVGTGRFAAASLAALRDRGAQQIEVWSPSGRGAKFAAKHDMPAVDSRDAALAAASADVIVTCTTADSFVISHAFLERGREALAATHAYPTDELAIRREAKRGLSPAAVAAHRAAGIELPDAVAEPATCPVEIPVQQCPVDGHGDHDGARCPVEHGRSSQLIIDMGMPRNVDPDVARASGVTLLDLETIAIHAPIEHLTANDDAAAIVDKAARTFARVGKEQELAPAVTALREHVHEALDAELARVRKHGTEAEQAAAEQALRHFAGVLLHKPSVRARELAATGRRDDFLGALEALFGIDVA